MDNFNNQGCQEFFLTLNYKKEMIKAYLNSQEKPEKIHFIDENKFLGTAGSLSLLPKERLADHFLLSNCDIIVDTNYEEIIKHHKEQNALITIISAVQHHKVPYGVIEYEKHGRVSSIVEKPEHSFVINTGVYFLNKEVLDYVPENQELDMPSLIEKLITDNQTVLTYPVNQGDYIDIGQWAEYRNAVQKLAV